MITTIYRCDRCGHEQPTSEQMWQVATICYHFGDTPFPYSHRGTQLWCRSCVDTFQLIHCGTQLWCRSCVDTFQLIKDPPPAKPGEPAAPDLTLEDKIREIVRNVIAEEAQP